MSNPLVHAFFVGRALAEAIGEQVENVVTNALGEMGKFDAEQRERLRQFTNQVMDKANREAELSGQGRSTTAIVPVASKSEDLQAVIDDLRAETAQLRAELQRYRNRIS